MGLGQSGAKTWYLSDTNPSRKGKRKANKLPLPSDTFYLPLIFMSGYTAKLEDKECKKLPRFPPRIYVTSSDAAWAFSPGLLIRGGQILEKRVGTTPSFSYFNIEKYLESNHVWRSTLKLINLQCDSPQTSFHPW